MYCTPGPDNSNLIRTENAVPNKPENKANIKYKVPISLAFEDKNHLSNHSDIPLTLLCMFTLSIVCDLACILFVLNKSVGLLNSLELSKDKTDSPLFSLLLSLIVMRISLAK